MNRNVVQAFAAATMAFALIGSTAACGSSTNGATSNPNAQASTENTASSDGLITSEAKSWTPSEAFKTKSIWFTNEPAKNESVGNVLVFDGQGKVTFYWLNKNGYYIYGDYEYTAPSWVEDTQILYKDLRGLSTDQILDLVKQKSKKRQESMVDVYSNLTPDEMGIYKQDNRYYQTWDHGEDKSYETEQEAADAFLMDRFGTTKLKYKEMEPVEYKLTMTTDDTGNNAKEEHLRFTYKEFEKEKNYSTELEPLYDSFPVYDVIYQGYSDLYTSTGGMASFHLDSPTTPGIKVDEDED